MAVPKVQLNLIEVVCDARMNDFLAMLLKYCEGCQVLTSPNRVATC